MVAVNKRWAVFAGFCLLWAGFAEDAKAAYVLTDLGPVEAYGINNSGWVTGRNSDGNAFIYIPGTGMTDIGILGGNYGSLGLSINTFGQVTGIINTAIDGSSYSNSASAFIYTPGSGMTLLDPWTYGYGINDLGQVSGFRAGDTAFIYTPGTGFESIEMLGQYSSIVSINNLGQGTGGSTTTPGSQFNAIIYTPGSGTVNIGTLGGILSFGSSINSAGNVTGGSYLPMSDSFTTSTHAFLYTLEAGMQDIGIPGKDSAGTDINEIGQIVGYYGDAFELPHAFLYTSETGMQDLNTLIDPALGVTLTYGKGINDLGQIIAYAADGHSYILSMAEVPEPNTLLLLCLGLLGLKLNQRKTIVSKRTSMNEQAP